jgi:ankyrin repeat protein
MQPLHCACWKGQTDVAEFLLSNGAQIAEADSSLMTALHWAVQFCHFETLLTLLKVFVLSMQEK